MGKKKLRGSKGKITKMKHSKNEVDLDALTVQMKCGKKKSSKVSRCSVEVDSVKKENKDLLESGEITLFILNVIKFSDCFFI